MNIVGYTALEGHFDHPTGVGKHIEQMFRYLDRASDVRFRVLCAEDQPPHAARDTHPLRGLETVTLPFRRRAAERAWALLPFPVIDRHVPDADWVYSPYEVPVATRRAKLAVTVHSCYHFDPELPGYGGRSNLAARLRWGPAFRSAVRRANLLLTVSEFVKRQMVDWFGADPERTVIVGNGVEQAYFDAGQSGPGMNGADRPYVVCVSGINLLDGAPYVLAIARELLRRRVDLEIRVAGHQHEEPFLAEAKALPNIKLLGYIDQRHLASLMNRSLAMLYLNRYESFGIGAVEAMAARTPVVATRFTAVPEVVGNAGYYVNVSRPADVVDFIHSLAQNPALRESLIVAGQDRANLFSWDVCGKRLHKALAAAD